MEDARESRLVNHFSWFWHYAKVSPPGLGC
jgi:hypothetical protein